MEVGDTREKHTISTNELLRMADFVLKNNFFEFNGQIKQQIPGAIIGTQFAPSCVCLLIEKTAFLENQELQHLCGLDILKIFFFIWTHGRQELQTCFHSLNEFHTGIKFTKFTKKAFIS